MTKKQYDYQEKLVASRISCFIAQHYVQELKATPAYNQKLKQTGNLYLKELEKMEEKEFDKLEEQVPEHIHALSNGYMDFIESMVKYPFTDMVLLQTVVRALNKDGEKMMKTIDEILNK